MTELIKVNETLQHLEYELEYFKGELEYSYRKRHRIAPSWLYERIHHLEKQIKRLKRKEK